MDCIVCGKKTEQDFDLCDEHMSVWVECYVADDSEWNPSQADIHFRKDFQLPLP